jgi:hypothetical protein
MGTELPRSNKVDAIYELREAVEAKARAERALEDDASPSARDALLAAQLDVEAKTQDAIEASHECGDPGNDAHTHFSGGHVGERVGDVVQVKFGREEQGA